MKFLCGNCGSKYQIADEKVSGRVLRMKCRRCSHDIVIDGQNPAGPSLRPPAPAVPAGGGASPGMRMPARGARDENVRARPRRASSSSLGAGFRRQVSNRPAPPRKNEALDQWHVAINNVPVGPIGRAEVLRKIGAGAVTGESLCWREGFDDWRPVREVPELAALLRQASASRPAPPPISRSVPPPRVPPASRQVGSRPLPHPHRAGDALRPAAHSNVVPIGGRLGAAAAPAMEPIPPPEPFAAPPASSPPQQAPVSSPAPSGAPLPPGASELPIAGGDMASSPPQHESASAAAALAVGSTSQSMGAVVPVAPAATGTRLPVGAWIAIAGSMAFGISLAVIFATRMGGPAPQPATQEPVAAVAPAPEPAPAPAPVEEPAVVPEELPEEPEEVEEDPGSETPSRTPRRSSSAKKTTKTKQLTAAEKARLERMAPSGTAAKDPRLSKFDTGGVSFGEKKKAPTGKPLNSQQLGSVVSKNRPSLTRCYERTIRSMGQAMDIRMNVTVKVGMSGKVISVKTSGRDVGGLGNCIKGAVRRWTFPRSGSETSATFPVVFQGK